MHADIAKVSTTLYYEAMSMDTDVNEGCNRWVSCYAGQNIRCLDRRFAPRSFPCLLYYSPESTVLSLYPICCSFRVGGIAEPLARVCQSRTRSPFFDALALPAGSFMVWFRSRVTAHCRGDHSFRNLYLSHPITLTSSLPTWALRTEARPNKMRVNY